jgi:serine/threonine protein kinase
MPVVSCSLAINGALKLKLAQDIAKGMLYLHTRHPPIVHRDVKSLNILVTKDWKAVVADFGLTKIMNRAFLNSYCGSPAWVAPEGMCTIALLLLDAHSRLGLANHQYFEASSTTSRQTCTATELCCGNCILEIFPTKALMRVLSLAKVCDQPRAHTSPCTNDRYQSCTVWHCVVAFQTPPMRPQIPAGSPHAFKNLMQMCWQEAAKSRPNFTTILETLNRMAALPDV